MKIRNILITLGDIGGISGEVVLKAFKRLALNNDEVSKKINRLAVKKNINLYLAGDAGVIEYEKNNFNIDIPIEKVNSFFSEKKDFSTVNIFPTTKIDISDFEYGKPIYGKEAIDYLNFAINKAKSGDISAIVTAPLSKEAVSKELPDFRGHTGYLAKAFGVENERMCFYTPNFLLMLQTVHIGLSAVSSSITKDSIKESLRILQKAGLSYHGEKTDIAVLALNPHAGEGIMGDEEEKVIIPAIKEAKSEGIQCYGPFPADSFFIEQYKNYGLILSMYHDQGLIAVKTMFPRKSVNVTLSLPVIRTSVDHGSGYAIAGKNEASEEGMLYAILAAFEMLAN